MPFWLKSTSSAPPLGWASTCLLAVLCAGVATAAEFAFGMLVPALPFAAYFPAVLVAALLGGVLAGTLTIVLSIIVVWWAFIPPYYKFTLLDASQSAQIALFALFAFVAVWGASRYRRTARHPEHE